MRAREEVPLHGGEQKRNYQIAPIVGDDAGKDHSN